MASRLGHKTKKYLRLGLKTAVGVGAVGAAALGVKGKGEDKFEEKKQELEDTIAAGKDIGQAVKGIGQATAADVAGNPLQAKKHLAKGKQMATGVVAAAKVDPKGAAAQVKFATAPKTSGSVDIKGATAYAKGNPAAKMKSGAAGGLGGGGDIRDCDTKYAGIKNKNQRRKCRTRVKGGGMP